jgi:carboxypeptidase C (cathepsin A)
MKLFLCGLLLGQVAASKKGRSKDDFLVVGLEDVEPAFESFQGTMYAGVLPVDEDGSGNSHTTKEEGEEAGHLMFWYFDAEKPTVDDTLVIWFNGGPGCSSFDAGMLFEFVS